MEWHQLIAFTSYGLDGKCDGIVFFSGSQYATRPYVLAHEVGHYLLGEFADVSPIDDPENLMTSGGSGTVRDSTWYYNRI